MQSSLVNIAMVSFNRLELTMLTLSSLFKFTDQDFHLTIVDNGSSAETVEYLKNMESEHKNLSVIFMQQNVGVAVAANFVWSRMQADYYLKIDNDIEILNKNWLNLLLEAAQEEPKLGMIGHKLLERIDVDLIQIAENKIFYQSNLCNGACVLIPKHIHRKLGFWNEDYGLYGYEDLDYSNRARQAGYIIGYASTQAYVKHLGYENTEYIDVDLEKLKQEYINSEKYGQKLYVINKLLFEKNIRKLYVQRKFVPKLEESGNLSFKINPRYKAISDIQDYVANILNYDVNGNELSLYLKQSSNYTSQV